MRVRRAPAVHHRQSTPSASWQASVLSASATRIAAFGRVRKAGTLLAASSRLEGSRTRYGILAPFAQGRNPVEMGYGGYDARAGADPRKPASLSRAGPGRAGG